MENKIDDLFKSGLNNLPEEFPSEQDWSALKKELNNAGLIDKKDNNKRRFFFWMFSGLLITGLAAFALYNSNTKNADAKNEVAKENLAVAEMQYSKEENSANESVESVKEFHEAVSKNHEQVEVPVDKKEEKSTVHKSSVSSAPTALKQKFTTVKNNNEYYEKKDAESTSPVEPIAQNPESKNEVQREDNSASNFNEVKVNEPAEEIVVSENVNNSNPIAADTAFGALVSLGDSSVVVAKLDTPAVDIEKDDKVVDDVLYRKFWGGGMLSLDYDNYNVKAANDQGSYLLHSYESGNQGALKYSAGLSFGYRSSKWFAVSADVLYSQKKVVDEHFEAPADSLTSDANFNLYHYNLQAKYLDVIVKPRVYVWHKKFSAYVFPGVVASFNLPGMKDKSYFTKSQITADGYIQDKINLEFWSAGFSLLGGVGVEYDLKNNWKISGEFSYRQSLTPVIQHATYTGMPLTFYSNSVNANVGIYKYF